jgi:acyl-coenzyme A synthetase/AMP-(fatty) acid ligase
VLDTVFNPKKLLRRQKEEISDILAIVPPMVKPLVYLGNLDKSYRMPDIVFYAGAQCNELLLAKFENAFNTTLYTIYGTTETGAITTDFAHQVICEGVGKPLKNVEVEVKKQERYSDMGKGIGEIFVKSTSMMQGYAEHWHCEKNIKYWPTGDIGFIDEQGNIHLTGRKNDIINLGGMKVDPREVEKILLEHPLIHDAVVYSGILDDSSDIIQAAICVNEHELEAKTIRKYCYKHLNSYKVPRKYHFVSEIPRSPSGKCLKRYLPGFLEAKNSV